MNSPLKVSENAKKHLKRICKEQDTPPFFRIYITGGGCSGFQYGFSFEESIQEDDFYLDVNDEKSIKVIVDPISIQYIKDGILEYVDTIMGQFFTVINPNATSTCGCGNSFDI